MHTPMDISNCHKSVHHFTSLKTFSGFFCGMILTLSLIHIYNIKWSDSNFFVSDNIGILSNCCRLLSDTKKLDAFINSIGGTAVSYTHLYRDELLQRKPHHNPSPIIDDLLKDNLGYLIYQEDTIKFLQEICGLSGSEADNVRRAIGRKQKDRLEAALPAVSYTHLNKLSISDTSFVSVSPTINFCKYR